MNQYPYFITIKNVGSTAIVDGLLRVILPPEVDFVSASLGNYDSKSHTLVIAINSLNPKEQAEVTATVRPNNSIRQGDTLTAMASVSAGGITNGSYTTSDTTLFQGNSNLASNALGGFLPRTFIGWLLLALIGFLGFLGFRWMYHRPKYNYYGQAPSAAPAPVHGAPAAPVYAPAPQPVPMTAPIAPLVPEAPAEPVYNYVPFDPNKK